MKSILRASSKRGWNKKGTSSKWCRTARRLWRARSGSYDLLILDWLLPDVDGLSVCQTLRAEGNRTPIIMLTAKDAVSDKVRGLDSGADDYLTKPFEFDELFARGYVRRKIDRGFDPPLLHTVARVGYKLEG